MPVERIHGCEVGRVSNALDHQQGATPNEDPNLWEGTGVVIVQPTDSVVDAVARLDAAVTARPLPVVKPSDTGRNSTTTLADDPVLKFEMEAGVVYSIDLVVFFTTFATPGFQYGIVGPGAAATGVCVATEEAGAAGTPAHKALLTALPASVGVSGGTGFGFVRFAIKYSCNASGTFVFQWAQNVSNASPATVKAGSHLAWRTP